LRKHHELESEHVEDRKNHKGPLHIWVYSLWIYVVGGV